jgi:sulfatase maturation enzyme AslB (radical SAM superfamily)
MKLTTLPRKLHKGLPYLSKELRAIVSDRTPFFVAVPRTVHIWRGGPCNARCIMCQWGYLKGDAYRKLITSPFTDDMMPRTLTQIHELCGRGTLVSYMTGEATLSKDLLSWVEQAASLGLDFRFTTNGYNMTEEMARRLVQAGVFNIGVSLESLDPAINETIRPYPNGTARTVKAIDLLLQERTRQKKHISINVKTVLTDVNLESFLEIIKRYGKVEGMMCTPQVFEPLPDMPAATLDKLYIKDVARLERVTNEVRKLKAEGYNVHVSEQSLREFVKLYREADGKANFTMYSKPMEMDASAPDCNIATDNLWVLNDEVRLCPNHPPIGNVATETLTLKQMWNRELARKVRAGTRACRQLCTISCLRRTPLKHKVQTFLKIA